MAITFSQLGKQGRLGNMLFQIAVTIATAKKNNTDYLFPSWQHELYFNLHDCFSNNIKSDRVYVEPHFHYSAIPPMNNMDLSGYFQSYKYFEAYDDLIRYFFEFTYPCPFQHNTTSIHVRRTDYLQYSEYHNDLSITNYYEKAINMLNSKKYLVFSDDIHFCKTKFVGPQFHFIENGTPESDMSLMASCENNILANSSFSWWAAYLNKNPHKQVIAPSQWFGTKLPHDTKDLTPKEWIRI